MKALNIRLIPLGTTVAAVAMIGGLALPNVAQASAKGRKNTTIGLGAATAHQLLKGKTTNALVLGAGTAYAYKRYKDADREEKRNRRATTYRSYERTASRNGSSYNRYGGSSVRTTANTRVARNGSRYVPPQRSNSRVTPQTFIFTGPVSTPTNSSGRTITVNHNGILRPAYVSENAVVAHSGSRLSVHDLRRGETVRVTAVQTGPNRWQAKRVDIVEPINGDVRARTARRETTYIDETVVNRDRFGGADGDLDDGLNGIPDPRVSTTIDRYTGTGVITRIAPNGRHFDLRVGNRVRRINVRDADYFGVSSISELRVGDQVRVVGPISGRNVFATDIRLVE